VCGICGIVNKDRRNSIAPKDIKKMTDLIGHRGPDDEGFFINKNVGLGMRRLSVIDISGGHQPIHNEDNSIQVVFNGEIYNFRQLREQLSKKGHIFYTHCDTEVIVHLYEEEKEDCVQKLRGMFAFALWDGNQDQLLLARDRIGIKPLHYLIDEGRLVFGSEIKSILTLRGIERDIDFYALDNFLTFEYIQAPRTIFKDIKKLLPGHILIYKGGRFSLKKYWDLTFAPEFIKDEVSYQDRLYGLLGESIKMRLMSDVPLGAFLSGGIDSSSVVALMSQVVDQPVKTFSIGFEDRSYNELRYAKIVANKFGTDHHEFVIKPDAISLVNKLMKYFDEPFGDISIFPIYLISKMAKEFVTVVLSGDGGDELFAGYDTYVANRFANYYRRLPHLVRKRMISPIFMKLPPSSSKKGFINIVRRFIEGESLPAELQHARWMAFLGTEEKERLYSDPLKERLRGFDPYHIIKEHFKASSVLDSLSQQQYVDIKTYLVDDILVKIDRMSMANSLEVRVPLLDHRFMELAASIPHYMRLKKFSTKHIFKNTMKRLLPLEIINRSKQGFSIPLKNWLRKDLKPMMLDILSEEQIKKRGYFNYNYVKKLIDEHLNGLENHSHRLWSLMVFELWYENYMDKRC